MIYTQSDLKKKDFIRLTNTILLMALCSIPSLFVTFFAFDESDRRKGLLSVSPKRLPSTIQNEYSYIIGDVQYV